MTLPLAANNTPPRRRMKGTRNDKEISLYTSETGKARFFLLFACIWPFILLALFASSSSKVSVSSVAGTNNIKRIGGNIASAVAKSNLRFNFQNVIDRVDIMGYGPTHPRVAVVIVGDNVDNLVASIESVFRNTDMNRIFVVCVVVDGKKESESITKELKKIDAGAIPHWHGLKPDVHDKGDSNKDNDEDPHGKKVHVMFNEQKRGLAESRADAVQFIQILQAHHENAGLKSPAEDIILLLLKSGASLTSRRWLAPVTDSLIVPPPIVEKGETTVALKLANAVAFNLEGPTKRTSFDDTFTRLVSDARADEVNMSSGASYATPAINGAATAMRLETYVNLPSHDTSLTDPWMIDLELSLNLWLCADGIDMLRDVEVTSFQQDTAAPLAPPLAAHVAATWMDDLSMKKFFNAYTLTYDEVTFLEWQTLMSSARNSPTFTKGIPHRCRSFLWYIQNVNDDLKEIAEQPDEPIEVLDDEEGEEDVDEENTSEGDDAAALPEQKLEKKPRDPPDVSTDDDGAAIPARNDKKTPSTPLRPTNLKIVQKAKAVNLDYVDVTGGFKDFPHKQALDVDGKPGYVHDATALRKDPPKLSIPDDVLQKFCLKRDNNYKMLHEKVKLDYKTHEAVEKSGKKRDKIFCLVYTIKSSDPEKDGHLKIPLIRETWGPKCDGFMVGSNATDPAIGAVNIPHQGPEEYNNIWQKVRSMWGYIYDNYYNDYDWFHIGGDDLYVLVENLRLYLESEEIKTAANGGIFLPDGTEKEQTPLFLGRRFAYQGDMNDIFISGGSGYTMNKAALKTLVVDGFQYFSNLKTFSEDTMVARTFRKFGIFPYDTKDDKGGERYMPFMPGHHYGYRMPQDHSKDWYANYSIDIKEGLDHCSAQSVAFHYVKGDSMKRLHALLYNLCPADTQE